MKRNFFSLVRALAVIMILIALISSDCGDNGNWNVGYHSIPIPRFQEPDYLLMLTSTNEEMQYNAICNLTQYKDYDKVLLTDSLKGTEANDSALLLYKKVYTLMDSKNDWVSSAAIRFIGGFKYNRGAFVQSVLKNSNTSLNVQLEIIMNLVDDTAKDQNLLDQKINFLQRQPSWLLQNGSLLLIGKNDSVSLQSFMQEYNKSQEEYKKLLILNVLTNHITDTVFFFLTHEWATTPNKRIKGMIFSKLPEANNAALPLKWFNDHYTLLEENIKTMITNISSEEYGDVYSKLVVMALEKQWKPSSIVMDKEETNYSGEPVLYVYLFANKYNEYPRDSIKLRQTAAGKRVEDALLQNPVLKNEWLVFEKKILKFLTSKLPQDLIDKHRQLTEEYLRQTKRLLVNHQIDTALYNGFKNGINEETKSLYEENFRKR